MQKTSSLKVAFSTKSGAMQPPIKVVNRVKEIVEAFLLSISCSRDWKCQFGTKEIPSSELRNVPNGTLVFRGASGSNPFTFQVHVLTTHNEAHELCITGPVRATDIATRIGNNKKFTLPQPVSKVNTPAAKHRHDHQRGDIKPGQLSSEQLEEIAMLMMLFEQNNGDLLVVNAHEFCKEFGWDTIGHCLHHGLISKNGTAAYSMTEQGREFLPAAEPEAPRIETEKQTPPMTLDLSALHAEVAGLMAILKEKEALEEHLVRAKSLASSANTEHQQKATEIKRLKEKITRIEMEAEHKRDQALGADKAVQEIQGKLNDPRFKEAYEKIQDLKRTLEELTRF